MLKRPGSVVLKYYSSPGFKWVYPMHDQRGNRAGSRRWGVWPKVELQEQVFSSNGTVP
jgi:hypothetical protein